MRYPTDDAPVRPGTSDALFARTIDATVHPPLVRAQETVVALGPRIAQSVTPFTSPVFLGLLGVTLIFVWVAHRMRYRPSALVLSALLVMGLTSFRPMQKWEQTKHLSVRPRTRIQQPARPQYYDPMPMTPEPVESPDFAMPIPVEVPQLPRAPEGDLTLEIMRRVDATMRDERVREMMQQLQYRLREEARSRRWRRIVARYRAQNGDFDPDGLVLTR